MDYNRMGRAEREEVVSMMERLPLSIKVDNESSLYTDLIEPKRDSRELTTFIVQLLELYHEKAEVREIMEEYLRSNNPYTEMQERLKEINAKHERNVTNRTFISQYTEVEQEKVESAKQGTEDGVEESGEGEGTSPLDELVDKLLPKLQEALQESEQESVEVEESPDSRVDMAAYNLMQEELERLREAVAKQESRPVKKEETKESIKRVEPEVVLEVEEGSSQEIEEEVKGIRFGGESLGEREEESSQEIEEEVKGIRFGGESLGEREKESKPRVSSAFSKMSQSL